MDLVVSRGEKRSEAVSLRESCNLRVMIQEDAEAFLLVRVHASEPIAVLQRCTIAKGGRLHIFLLVEGQHVEYSIVSECAGQHASSTIDWIFHATAGDQHTLSAKNVFNAPDGEGEITMKGIAEGHAIVKCNGMIEIGEKGRGTKTHLTENVLMLDPTAYVDAIPGLEIRTNDVKASHSATISKITEENLFYLQSRGITKQDARQMFVQGFLGDLLERIQDRVLREKITETFVASIL